MSFGARALIRLGAIRQNLDIIKARVPGGRVMAVVKANAYGHGLIPVAGCLEDADCLAVARLPEAIALREAGIDTPIALLGGVLSEGDAATALAMGLQLGIHSEPHIEWLRNCGKANGTVWLKFDTGMNRLGFRPENATALIDRLQACPAVGELRIMTHFSSADDVTDGRTRDQIAAFNAVVAEFGGEISVANSAAIFGWADDLEAFSGRVSPDHFWVRPGLTLYGISPFPDRCGSDLGLQPAMQFESRLISVKPLVEGETVGYGGTWRSDRDSTLGIVAAGYGDGYSRFIPSGSPVIVNDRRVTVAGLISMDLTAVDLGPDATDKVGDPVILWGKELPVEEVAAAAGTIPYQLLCGVSHREPPAYMQARL